MSSIETAASVEVQPPPTPLPIHARLSVSVVYYDTPTATLLTTLASLGSAIEHASDSGALLQPSRVLLVVNGALPLATDAIAAALGAHVSLTLLQGHGNVGYGRGNNLAIHQAESDYHLVLNPDVTIARGAIAAALRHLAANAACVCVTANAKSATTGEREYLAKREPTFLLLAIRGFAPAFVKRYFATHLSAYEMQDADYASVFTVDIASGAFMFCRTAPLKSLGGFDPAYFLYFEDFDLSRRLRAVAIGAQIHYVPSVQIEHAGGGAARKGLRHVWLFARSAVRYFSRR